MNDVDAEIEIDDGTIIIRLGSLSLTVLAETVTMYDTEKSFPAKKIPLSDDFWQEAEPFLSAGRLN